MRLYLAAALLCASSSSFAGYVFDNGPLRIYFHDAPCSTQAIAEYMASVGKAKDATITANGKHLKGCWILDEDGDFLIVDEMGNGGFIEGKQVKNGKDA